MKNNTLLSSIRERTCAPGILMSGVLALSQTLVTPVFAQTDVVRTVVTDESPAKMRTNNAATLAEIKKLAATAPATKAKNVIVFLGDGMGVSTITAARILEGQNVKKMVYGEENLLSFEKFPNTALSRNYSMNQQVPDSAPTMTAIMTGLKTNGDVLALNKTVGFDEPAKVSSSTRLVTLMEQAKAAGKAAGVVSTARVTHATPAACYAHSPNRDFEFAGYQFTDKSKHVLSNGTISAGTVAGATVAAGASIAAEYLKAGVKDIAAQLVDAGSLTLDVALGGGRTYFMPTTQADPEGNLNAIVTGTVASGVKVIPVTSYKVWLNGSLTDASTLPSTGNIVSGSGIPLGTTVSAYDPATGALTLSAATTGSVSGTIFVGTTVGKRTDGRDLIAEWKAKAPNSAYVWNKADFDKIPATTTRLLGLWEPSHVQYETDRVSSTVIDPLTGSSTTVNGDKAGEPSLTEQTSKAIDILSKNSKGYVLMVEAGRIDHAHHAGNAYRALTDTIEFSNAIKKAVEKVGPDTLIVVTADHSHVFTIAGYPDRGNPILGLVKSAGVVSKDLLGLPYTTLGYQNGPGYSGTAYSDAAKVTVAKEAGVKVQGFGTPFAPLASAAASGRVDLTSIITTGKGYMQETAVPLNNETHSGEDIVVFAKGPNAHLFRGSLDQSMIYYVMADALGFAPGK